MTTRRKFIKALTGAAAAGTSIPALSQSGTQLRGKYDSVMQAFPEGTWVFGTGEHKGCSKTFDYQYPDRPQPFSFLDADNPADFRFATTAEIDRAKRGIYE